MIFFDILNQVHKLGILFVIASGRPYPTLAMQFESCMDKLVFMAENGGCLVNGDKLVHQDILDTDALSYLLSGAPPSGSRRHSDSLRLSNGLSLRSDIGRCPQRNRPLL
ncbi:MAG: HAD hydrolase family protein [Ruminococcus sp.]